MDLNNLFKSCSKILLLLFAKIQSPLFVIHTFVAFACGLPLHICTWIGSKFSFAQKKIVYPK